MSRSLSVRLVVAMLVASLGLATVTSRPAGAAEFMVTSTSDSDSGSLREAILEANRDPETADVIKFDFKSLSPPVVITLDSQLPAITAEVTIDGTSGGVPGVTLRPNSDVRPFPGLVIGSTDAETDAAETNVVITGLNIGGFDVGVVINSSNNTLQDSYIGTDSTGSESDPNGVGVLVAAGTRDNVIARNIISGNRSHGVNLAGGVAHVVVGNYIGTTYGNSAALGNGEDGIRISSSNMTVGGFSTGDGNVIAFNGGDGIAMVAPSSDASSGGEPDQVQFVSNFIFDNAGLGIDLAQDGVDVNDSDDGDGGVNDGQNYPVIKSVVTDDGVDTVSGTLNSTPMTTFFIELFSNVACDPSGYGEGRIPVGGGNVTTGDSGFASFSFVSSAENANYTATATAPQRHTSEFSGCVVDDDPTPELSVADVSVGEGKGPAVFTVSMSGPSSDTVTVSYATADGTATAPGDYTATAATATIAAGATSTTVSVPVADDALDEAAETFALKLLSPDGATLADSTAVATIVDDDYFPTLKIFDASVVEGNAGTAVMKFVLSVNIVQHHAISVAYSTRDGTAVETSDYAASTGIATIPPGVASVNVEVLVNGDTQQEDSERFFLDLSEPSGALLGRQSAPGVIIDDDAPDVVPPANVVRPEPAPDLPSDTGLDPRPPQPPAAEPSSGQDPVDSGVPSGPALIFIPAPTPLPPPPPPPPAVASPRLPAPARPATPPAPRPTPSPRPATTPSQVPAPAPATSPPVVATPTPAPPPAVTPPAARTTRLSLDRPSVEPGGQAMATGEGCDPGSSVRLSAAGRLVGTAIADDSGRFRSAVVFDGVDVGRYEITAVCGPTLLSQLDVVLSSNVSGGGSVLVLALFFLLLAGSLFPRQFRRHSNR